MKRLQNMNTFEMCFMFACFIHFNSAHGLQKIFPSITDSFDDVTEIPFSVRNDFERNELYSSNENNERQRNPLLIPDDKRLTLLKNSLSDIGEILKDIELDNVPRGYKEKKSSHLDHLRGVIVPSFDEMSYGPGGNDIASSLFPALFNRRQTLMRTHKHSNTENVQWKRKLPTIPSKRKSAITPPSRDWCRLIGYRVCPRAARV